MKRSSEKIAYQTRPESFEESGVSRPPRSAVPVPSTGLSAQRNRPEIAVLGWDVRSYRLALRESKE